MILDRFGNPITTQATVETPRTIDAFLATLTDAQRAAFYASTTGATANVTLTAPVPESAVRASRGGTVYAYLRKWNTDRLTASGKVNDTLSTIGKSKEMRARLRTKNAALADAIVLADAQGDVFPSTHPIVTKAPDELRNMPYGTTRDQSGSGASYFAWAWGKDGSLCVVKPYLPSDRHDGIPTDMCVTILRIAMLISDGRVKENDTKDGLVPEMPINGPVAQRVIVEMAKQEVKTRKM